MYFTIATTEIAKKKKIKNCVKEMFEIFSYWNFVKNLKTSKYFKINLKTPGNNRTCTITKKRTQIVVYNSNDSSLSFAVIQANSPPMNSHCGLKKGRDSRKINLRGNLRATAIFLNPTRNFQLFNNGKKK